MKKNSVFPVLFIIIYLLSAINPIYSQENKQIGKYNFSLGGGFGFIYGQALELVHPNATEGEFLSQLIWEIKPVYYAGFKADLGLSDPLSVPGFFSSLAVKAGIPGYSGNLEDRDWQSIENADLTSFSRHKNETNGLIWIDLSAGASLPVKYLYIKPFLSGSWMHFSFSGKDGYGIYARKKGYGIYYSIDDNPDTVDYSGKKVITYQQDWLLLAAGFSIGTTILVPFSFDISFQISPIAYCAASDNHLTRNIVFKDFTYLGFFLEPKFNVSFNLKKFAFSLEASYRYISKTTGESYENIDGEGYKLSENKAGAGLSVMDCQLIFKYKF